jgi:hypothetical protein
MYQHAAKSGTENLVSSRGPSNFAVEKGYAEEQAATVQIERMNWGWLNDCQGIAGKAGTAR